MSDVILIVFKYSPVEDQSKLLPVFEKLNLEATLKFLNVKDFKVSLLSAVNKIICLDDSYPDLTKILAEHYLIPRFEFSVNNYLDKDRDIVLCNVPLTIDLIFKPTNKKYAWNILQQFKKQTESVSTKAIAQKVTEEPELVIKEILKEEVVETPVKTEILKNDLEAKIQVIKALIHNLEKEVDKLL